MPAAEFPRAWEQPPDLHLRRHSPEHRVGQVHGLVSSKVCWRVFSGPPHCPEHPHKLERLEGLSDIVSRTLWMKETLF